MKAQHVLIILAFLLFGSCVARKKEAEVRYENGIKHIVNPISPAGHTTGERRLDLIREFSIDFENTGSSRPSFTEVIGFDVDAAGNTFVLTTRSGDEFVHIFGSRGEYRASFGRQGQGPGELQDPKYIEVHASTVTILDFGKKKLLEYGTDGVYARESPVPSNVRRTASLNGGHRIVLRGRPDQESGLIRFPVLLCDASFNDLKALSPGKSMPIFALAKKINGLDLGIDYEAWQIFDKSIYVGDPGGGYDIKIYDFEGRPKLVISKKYNPVPVSEEYKQHINDWMGKNARESLGKLLFPSFFPAYRYFFLDEGVACSS